MGFFIHHRLSLFWEYQEAFGILAMFMVHVKELKVEFSLEQRRKDVKII